jgi:hypothetical protein
MIILIFTISGLASSAVLGTMLGLAAQLMEDEMPATSEFVAAALVLTVASFTVRTGNAPSLQRQTPGFIAMRFGDRPAAAIWGSDLGLAVTTYVQQTGPWLIIVATILLASPLWGAVLLASYWLGRAATSMIAPLLLDGPNGGRELSSALASLKPRMRQLHAIIVVFGFMATMAAR